MLSEDGKQKTGEEKGLLIASPLSLNLCGLGSQTHTGLQPAARPRGLSLRTFGPQSTQWANTFGIREASS